MNLEEILGYDEGGYDGISYDDSYSMLQWAGVRFEVSDTALLSGIETVFPPSFWSWDVTDYTFNIWEGWQNNKPTNFLYTSTRNVNWDPDTYRDGGWAHISLLEEAILWNAGETYYVEINFNGTGGVYPVDIGVYSSSVNDSLSFYRGNTGESCKRLTEHVDADWNIRAVLSGDEDYKMMLKAYKSLGAKAVVRGFLDDMPTALGAADLALGRSGASSLAEMEAAQISSVLIPLPTSANDHQRYNAKNYSANVRNYEWF